MLVPQEREESKNFEGMPYGYSAGDKLTHRRKLKIDEKKEKGQSVFRDNSIRKKNEVI